MCLELEVLVGSDTARAQHSQHHSKGLPHAESPPGTRAGCSGVALGSHFKLQPGGLLKPPEQESVHLRLGAAVPRAQVCAVMSLVDGFSGSDLSAIRRWSDGGRLSDTQSQGPHALPSRNTLPPLLTTFPRS